MISEKIKNKSKINTTTVDNNHQTNEWYSADDILNAWEQERNIIHKI